jgi:hypothetical protein
MDRQDIKSIHEVKEIAENTFQLHQFLGHTEAVTSVIINREGTLLISGGRDKMIMVWSLETGKCLQTLVKHHDSITSLALSQDGSLLVSGSLDQTACVWSLKTGECLKTFAHSAGVSCVAFLQDSDKVITGASGMGNIKDCNIRVWSIKTGLCEKELVGHKEKVTGVALSRQGDCLVSSSHDKTLRVWSVESGTCLKVLSEHKSYVGGVAFSFDNQQAFSAGSDGTIRTWSLETGKALQKFTAPRTDFNSVMMLDANTIVASGEDQTLWFWSLPTGKCFKKIHLGSNVFTLHPIQGSKQPYVIAGFVDGSVKVQPLLSLNESLAQLKIANEALGKVEQAQIQQKKNHEEREALLIKIKGLEQQLSDAQKKVEATQGQLGKQTEEINRLTDALKAAKLEYEIEKKVKEEVERRLESMERKKREPTEPHSPTHITVTVSPTITSSPVITSTQTMTNHVEAVPSLKELDELLKKMRTDVLQNAGVDLEPKERKEKAELPQAEKEKNFIFGNPHLSDYYYFFQLQFNDALTACKVIHSNMVNNDTKSGWDILSSGLQGLASHIPIAGIVVDVVGEIFKFISQEAKKETINRGAAFLVGAKSIEDLGEVLARQLTLAQSDFLPLRIPAAEVGTFQKNWQKLKEGLLVTDVNTKIRQYADAHCKKLLKAIYEGKIPANPRPDNVEPLLETILEMGYMTPAERAKQIQKPLQPVEPLIMSRSMVPLQLETTPAPQGQLNPVLEDKAKDLLLEQLQKQVAELQDKRCCLTM